MKGKDIKMVKEKKRLSKKVYMEKKKEKFLKRHTCKICGQPLSFVQGTNVMICTNPECKGIEQKKYEQGKEITVHESFYSLLDDRGIQIANMVYNE